jgi:hypothetical protein
VMVIDLLVTSRMFCSLSTNIGLIEPTPHPQEHLNS